jgi:hypothetical protein
MYITDKSSYLLRKSLSLYLKAIVKSTKVFFNRELIYNIDLI